jgi:hypothetical protein
LFAGTEKGVNLSTNNGASWISRGLSSIYVSSFAVSGGNLFAGSYGRGVFLSTDNGTSWNAASNPMLATSYVQSLAVSGTNLFAGADGGVFLSTNNGTSWLAVGTGLQNNGVGGVGALAVSGSNLFVGPYSGGVWRRPLSDFAGSGVKTSTAAPATIELSPNPTNGIMHVRSLSAGDLHATAANILGERVASAHTQGSNLSLDLTNFPAGVYYVHVTMDGAVTTRMVVRQ